MLHCPASKSETMTWILEAEVRSGLVGDDTALASESALMRRFGVSGNTVRRGLGAFSAKGLIQTMTGIGFFVTSDGQVPDSAAGWHVAL